MTINRYYVHKYIDTLLYTVVMIVLLCTVCPVLLLKCGVVCNDQEQHAVMGNAGGTAKRCVQYVVVHVQQRCTLQHERQVLL